MSEWMDECSTQAAARRVRSRSGALVCCCSRTASCTVLAQLVKTKQFIAQLHDALGALWQAGAGPREGVGAGQSDLCSQRQRQRNRAHAQLCSTHCEAFVDFSIVEVLHSKLLVHQCVCAACTAALGEPLSSLCSLRRAFRRQLATRAFAERKYENLC